MKAIETTATINESGQLTLDKSLGFIKPQRVRVIVLQKRQKAEGRRQEERSINKNFSSEFRAAV